VDTQRQEIYVGDCVCHNPDGNVRGELLRFERSTFGYDKRIGSAEQLDDLFRGALKEVWADSNCA